MAKVKIKKKINPNSPKLPTPIVDSNRPVVEDRNPTDKEVAVYQDAAKKNLEGTTRVTRQMEARKIAGKDCGESSSTKTLEEAMKKDPSIATRVKNMVKKW